MSTSSLSHLRVAVIAADGVEEAGLAEPVRALREAQAQVDIVTRVNEADASDYEALLLPGGILSADRLRGVPEVQRFVKAIDSAGKPIAGLCYAAWILASAGVARGRKLTSIDRIREDLTNAGSEWVDEPACVDQNWVTSRTPDDLPSFIQEMLGLFGRATPPVIQVAESA